MRNQVRKSFSRPTTVEDKKEENMYTNDLFGGGGVKLWRGGPNQPQHLDMKNIYVDRDDDGENESESSTADEKNFPLC